MTDPNSLEEDLIREVKIKMNQSWLAGYEVGRKEAILECAMIASEDISLWKGTEKARTAASIEDGIRALLDKK